MNKNFTHRFQNFLTCHIDKVFHVLAYGRIKVPYLSQLENYQPLRGWCDKASGITPSMRLQLNTLAANVLNDKKEEE